MKVTNSILTNLYPKVSTNTKKNINKYKRMMSVFIQERADSLYDIAPCDRIVFGAKDKEAFYNALDLNEKEITSALEKTFYYYDTKYNTESSVKDELSVAALCVIRHFFLANDKKNLELSMIYLAFSGKYYPSTHSLFFPVVTPSEYRHVMEYAINNMSNKYDIVREGSVIGAFKSICNTWLMTYKSRLKDFQDDDVIYLLQQLKSRIRSFMKNIASEYYKAYENNEYITYDSDSLIDGDYHLADSDSLKMERTIEKSINKIQTTSVDYRLCKMCNDTNVHTDELKAIIDSILSNKENFILVKELIRIIITLYFSSGKTKDVRDIAFINFTMSPKPNSKDKLYLRQKEIIEELLLSNSSRYKTRSKRAATKISYNKVILMYFTLVIHEANK